MRDKNVFTRVEDDTNCSGIGIFNLVETILLICNVDELIIVNAEHYLSAIPNLHMYSAHP